MAENIVCRDDRQKGFFDNGKLHIELWIESDFLSAYLLNIVRIAEVGKPPEPQLNIQNKSRLKSRLVFFKLPPP